MSKVVRLDAVPENSIIANGFETIDYVDSFIVNMSVDKITTEVFNSPKWVDRLMLFRNFLVRIVGLRTNYKIGHQADYYPIGSIIMGFTVLDRTDNEIVMGEDDKHLIFRVSVLVDKDVSNIYVTTIVHYHNWLGRFYFFFVKPFHRVIVKKMTKNLYKR